MKKQNGKLYVIRKVVNATSFSEALRKEKDAEIVEIVLAVDKEGKIDVGIGFGWTDAKKE